MKLISTYDGLTRNNGQKYSIIIHEDNNAATKKTEFKYTNNFYTNFSYATLLDTTGIFSAVLHPLNRHGSTRDGLIEYLYTCLIQVK